MPLCAAIVNPHAAAGRAARLWPDVARRLESRLGPVLARFTERGGHAINLAGELLREGRDRIFVAGGDGTVNEVANGFFDRGRPLQPDAALAILPVGSGSDLCRTLGIPRSLRDAIDALAAGVVRLIDVGHARYRAHDGAAQERLFVNIASFGLGGDAAARARTASYPRAILQAVLHQQPKQVRIRLDASEEELSLPVADVAVGNGRFQAGGIQVCPAASPDDGLFDVTVVELFGLLELLGALRLLFSGNIYRHPKVRHYRTAGLSADSADSVPLELDGEPLGTLPLEITLLPRCLPMVVPQNQ